MRLILSIAHADPESFVLHCTIRGGLKRRPEVIMDTNMLINRTLRLAFVGISLAIAPALAFGQHATNVTVEAPQIRHDVQPIGKFGALVPSFSASYRVSYADLDVATYAGATALEDRVRTAAKRVCKQIAREERASSEGDPPCVKGALKAGMLQAHAAIIAAEARARANAAATTIAATDAGEYR